MSLWFRLQMRRVELRAWRRRGLLRTLFFLYFVTMTIFSVIGDRGLWGSYRLKSEIGCLDAKIEKLETQKWKLRKDVNLFRNDRRTLERYAREELRLAGENEIHYIFR